MDYKDTLFLPKTTFPMRGNLPQNEPKTYQQWSENNVYQKFLEPKNEHFNLHDGPPYANGHLHIGHALNKILKDIVIKFHYFQGKSINYTPGWDCHGLPIEQQIEKKLGAKKDSLPISKIRELCRAHASEFIEIQKKEFLELGIIGDFKNPYKTMDFSFESSIYRALCKIAKKGLLKERSKPVFWSWAAKSALAEAEVEYENKEDYSIFVSFKLEDFALDSLQIKNLDTNKPISAVIWTTTPWTLPANQAICLNPNENYAITKEGYIFAEKLIESAVKEGLTSGEIVKIIEAKKFEHLRAINPLNNRKSLFILGEHVEMSGGSGLVHSAPGHGEDDYFSCLKYNIEVLMPVDDNGCFDEVLRIKKLLPDEVLDDFIGLHVFKSNEKILKLLGDSLLKSSRFIHSYPFCWRTHEPVIYRATKQLFILMDEPFTPKNETLRQIALKNIKATKFYPEHGLNRIYTMIENRPDWCISRQRDWGVPIAFFRDKRNDEIILDDEILDFIANIFEKEGCDAWWNREIIELLPTNHKHLAPHLEKINHILDVWFDSGSSWHAVLDNEKFSSGKYPADMYLEGSDQHRGWFQSSLLVSSAINECAPYKSILTHGFSMDGDGEKMSKSKGNVIAPQDVIKKYGSEILRLWVAQSDYQNDQRISDSILNQVSENYRKIRNTIRFLLANTNDFHNLWLDSFSQIDLWILFRADVAFGRAIAQFGNYDFTKALSEILYFLSTELSGVYLDICKDNLYCNSFDSPARIGSLSAMSLILGRVLGLLAPILTYSINEALSHTNSRAVLESCGLKNIDLIMDKKISPSVFDIRYVPLPELPRPKFDFELLLKFRGAFLEQVDILKKDGKIKSTLELSISQYSAFSEFSEMNIWLMISSDDGEKLGEFTFGGELIKIYRAKDYKCPRCWQFSAKSENGLCARCENALKENA